MHPSNALEVNPSPVARAVRDRWSTLVVTALALVAFAVPAIVPWLEYRRDLPFELWRLLACHWTHFDLDHLFWSGSMFALLAALLEPRGRLRLLLCIVASALSVAIAVHLATPALTTYRGLSGVDSALFVLLLLDLVREARDDRRALRMYAALGAGFAAKLAFEFWSGGAVFASATSYDPVPMAHLAGAAVGLAFGMWPAAVRGPQSGPRRRRRARAQFRRPGSPRACTRRCAG